MKSPTTSTNGADLLARLGRSDFQSELDAVISKVHDSWRNIGIAVGVVANDELVYAHGFGSAQAGQTIAIGPDTLFQVGSTTKAVAAAALGILVDEGKLRWTDLISDYVPQFQLQDPHLTTLVTIEDALCHRTGVSDRSYLHALGIMSTDEAIRQLRYAPAELNFRDSYCYNNLMYAALGKVTEAVSGMSWGAWVRTRLLEPLNMVRTGTSPYQFWDSELVAPTFLGSAPAGVRGVHGARVSDLAMPHGFDAGGTALALPWRSYDSAAPAGSLISSVADMANWLIFNLNQGTFSNQQLLNRRTLAECHALHNARIDAAQYPFRAGTESYAFGWRRTEYHGLLHLSHGGGIVGSPAYVALLPSARLGVVALSNGSALARDDLGSWRLGPNKAIAFSVFDRILGLPARDWNRDFLAGAQAVRQSNEKREKDLTMQRAPRAPGTLPLEQYAGLYGKSDAYTGDLTVTEANGHLVLCFEGMGAYSAILDPWQGHQFRVLSHPGIADLVGIEFATFAADSSGKVGGLTIFSDSFRRIPPRNRTGSPR